MECSDSIYYTGITNNVPRRITEHNAGVNKNCFTFNRRPVELKFQQEFMEVKQAIYFEKKIKKWSRAKKRALIEGDCNLLPILAECKNQTHYKNKPE